MSHIHFTNKILGIEDKHIQITRYLGDFMENHVQYSYYEANLTYEPTVCPHCGNTNRKFIHKHGSKITRPKLPKAGGKFIRLKLHKQRFLCLNCQSTFCAQTDLVKPNHTISIPLRREIAATVSTKISEKEIAQMNGISFNTVGRVIDEDFQMLDMQYNSLPQHLCFDEFKSTKRCKGAMSFLFCDATNGQVLDIVENRQLPFLLRYFRKYTKQTRARVKSICIDMYAPYISLIHQMFPNATIAIDRFHVVQLLGRAFTKTRIRIMKSFPTSTMEYKRLKRYWKLLHKKDDDLAVGKYRKFTHFRMQTTEFLVVQESIRVSEELEQSYLMYQTLLHDIRMKKQKDFYEHVLHFLSEPCSSELKTALLTLQEHMEMVLAGIETPFSNGVIEGVNNFIKALKRIAFGYKSFFHFRNRILICKKLIIPKAIPRLECAKVVA